MLDFVIGILVGVLLMFGVIVALLPAASGIADKEAENLENSNNKK